MVFSAPFALMPLAGGPTWARAGVLALVEFISAVGVMCLDIPLNALMTAVTPDGVRSRVAGAFSTVNYGIRPLGAVAGGLVGEWIGVAPTMVVAAVGGSLSVLWLLRTPVLATRSIDELDAVQRREPGLDAVTAVQYAIYRVPVPAAAAAPGAQPPARGRLHAGCGTRSSTAPSARASSCVTRSSPPGSG